MPQYISPFDSLRLYIINRYAGLEGFILRRLSCILARLKRLRAPYSFLFVLLPFPNFLSLEMYVPSITQKFPSHPPQIGELSLDCRRPSNPVNANFISQNLSTVFLRLCLNLYLSNTSNITGRQNRKHNKTRNARLPLSLCQRLWVLAQLVWQPVVCVVVTWTSLVVEPKAPIRTCKAQIANSTSKKLSN